MNLYTYRARVVRVVDGDTIDVIFSMGFGIMYGNGWAPVRLRLAGIDTPETHGVKRDSPEFAAGMEAKLRLIEMLAGTTNHVVVKTEKDKTGKFGRYLGWVYPDPDFIPAGSDLSPDVSVNKMLLDQGFAKEYRSKRG